MSAPRNRPCSSGAVEKVLSGTAIAPIRAAARNATTKSAPFGYSSPTRVPLPAPQASRPLASSGRSSVRVGVA